VADTTGFDEFVSARRNIAVVTAVAAAMAVVAIPIWLTTQRTTGSSPAQPAGIPTANPCSLVGCPSEVMAQLHRPLHLPTVQPGQSCPVGPTRGFPAGGGSNVPFVARGQGPVYLSGASAVSFTPEPDNTTDRPGDAKVGWVFDAAYDGPLLFRGAQLDGDHSLRFDRYLGTIGYSDGPPVGPYDEVVYQRDSWAQDGPGYYTYPGSLRLQAAGCYAVQIDGIDFTETLVFEAVNPNRDG
jgi:hypothetical protein